MREIDKFARRHGSEVEELRRWLVEAMVLGAAADGTIDRKESERIVDEIATRPEFVGMNEQELRDDLEAAWSGLVHDGATVRLYALAGALRGYPQRVLAFRASVSTALSNGAIEPSEVEFLREMQGVLGIHESDVARAFEEIQGSDESAWPERVVPVDAYLDCLLMAGMSDGHFADIELATVIAFILSRPEFDGLPEEHIRASIEHRLEEFSRRGVEGRLAELGAEFVTDEERENAYGLALSITMADAELDAEEREFLLHLRRALGIADERAAAMRDAVCFDEVGSESGGCDDDDMPDEA